MKICKFSILFLLSVCLVASTAFASNLTPDNVLSVNITEADGTSGQDTDSGSGIKTDHIQDGAVTAPKLGIVCPDGYYLHYSLAAGWDCSVGTPGPVGPQGPTGLTGPQGQQGETGPVGPMPAYSKMAVVAQSGGDYTDPVSAMNDLAAWCGVPSASNPCLLKIMPGIYSTGSGNFQMQSFLDVEGSGENTTKITGNPGSGGVVNGASHAEIRLLTVEHTGGVDSGTGIYNNNASPKITDVTILVSGSRVNRGIVNWYAPSLITVDNVTITVSVNNPPSNTICRAIDSSDSGIRIMNSTLTVSGCYNNEAFFERENSSLVMTNSFVNAVDGYSNVGVWGNDSIITLNGVTVNVSGTMNYGVDVQGYSSPTVAKINNSSISAPGIYWSVFNFGSASTFVSNTLLDGPISTSVKCLNVYDQNYDPITCP